MVKVLQHHQMVESKGRSNYCVVTPFNLKTKKGSLQTIIHPFLDCGWNQVGNKVKRAATQPQIPFGQCCRHSWSSLTPAPLPSMQNLLTEVFWHCTLELLNLKAGTLCSLPWMFKMHS